MNSPARILSESDFIKIAPLIAAELAAELLPADEIFTRFGFSTAQSAALLESAAFQSMIQDARQTWAGPDNTPARIRLKSQLALEEMIAPHYEMGINAETTPMARNEIMKTFERLSGINVGKDVAGMGGGEKFSVTINLNPPGAPPQTITVTGPVLPQQEEDDAA